MLTSSGKCENMEAVGGGKHGQAIHSEVQVPGGDGGADRENEPPLLYKLKRVARLFGRVDHESPARRDIGEQAEVGQDSLGEDGGGYSEHHVEES